MSDHSKTRRQRSHSFFGPVVMIAMGVYFLLFNFGIVNMPNWGIIFQLWPLWLIFLGANIIVGQVPRPFGGFLSGLVGLTAVILLGYVLLFSEDNPLLARLQTVSTVETTTEEISFTPEDASSATVEIDLNAAGAQLFALEDSTELIAGTVSYTGDLIFDTDESRDGAYVRLDTRSDHGFSWLNPSNWQTSAQDKWQIGLSPNSDISLKVDGSSGSTTADLSNLSLTYLFIDGGSGSIDVQLPNGEYDMDYDAGSGSTTIILPENGRFDVNIDGGSGRILLTLPDSMAARIDVNDGSGSFWVNGRFEQISGDSHENSIWQTDDYNSNTNQIDITLDIGSGSIRIDN